MFTYNQDLLYIYYSRERKLKIPILLMLLLYMLANTTLGQIPTNLHFKNFTVEDGLSSNIIHDIYQDRYGFMWIGTHYGLNRYDGHTFKQYFYDANDSLSLNSNEIWKIWEDKRGDLWVGTSGSSICRLDREKDKFVVYRQDANWNMKHLGLDSNGIFWVNTNQGLASYDPLTLKTLPIPGLKPKLLALGISPASFMIDHENILWLATKKAPDPGPLIRVDLKSGDIKSMYDMEKKPNILSHSFVSTLYCSELGDIWVGTLNGLNLWNQEQNTFQQIYPTDYLYTSSFKDPYLKSVGWNYILSISEDEHDNLWLGTVVGLLYFDRKKNSMTPYHSNTNSPNSLLGKTIPCLYIDKSGTLWVGTANGISIWHPWANQFKNENTSFMLEAFNYALGARKIIQIDETFFITDENGLFRIKDGQLKTLSTKSFIGLNIDKEGYIYAGTIGGFYCFPNTKENIDSYFIRSNGGFAYSFAKDKYGKIWIASNGTLVRYDLSINKGKESPIIKDKTGNSLSVAYYKLLIDTKGGLWIGTTSGLAYADVKELNKPLEDIQYTVYKHHLEDSTSLSSDLIHEIYEASDGTIWVATESGLNRFDKEKKCFQRFLTKDGLADNNIREILEDEQGNLWLAYFNAGIGKFNPQNGRVENFSKEYGVFTHELRVDGGVYTADKKMLFTGSKSIVSFDPQALPTYNMPISVKIVDFQLFHESVKIGDLLSQPIYLTNEIELEHNQNVLSFEFSALNYAFPDIVEYSYQLEGFENEEIQHLGKRREVTFTLPHGRYILRVFANIGENEAYEIEQPLTIIVHPPWWLSTGAKIIYFLLSLGLLYGIYTVLLNRQLDKAENQRLKELDQVKTRLYTNITHEFRTPLTVIQGMADKVEEAPKKWLNDGISMIKRNSHHLLRLVNQMLDLAKLEAGKLSLNNIQADIIPYIHYLIESFNSYAVSRDIHIHTLSDVESLNMDYDPLRFRNIISNLISNAIKYTDKGGQIYIRIMKEKGLLKLVVRDTGIGIPPEKLTHIFDRFYQADDSSTRKGEGTGIGLTLTKELVKLMEGKIFVKSTLGKGSEFSVLLPIRKNSVLTQHAFENESNIKLDSNENLEIEQLIPHSDQNADLPLVLIIEDNPDVVNYLESCLEKNYRIEVATNGQKGIDKAFKRVPDMIISDVMMPEKDGFEVCEILKQDWQTSHIPIILLTAKADVASRIEGLEMGADAYLAKPFSEEELQVRLKKLHALRKMLQAKYSSPDSWVSSIELKTSTLEDIFIRNLREMLEEHLTDPHLDITKMCKLLGVGKTQLNRKIKALTGKPTKKFVKEFRFAKAQELLKNTDLSIKNIAYDVGFDNPNWFTRSFTDRFGKTPTDFRSES